MLIVDVLIVDTIIAYVVYISKNVLRPVGSNYRLGGGGGGAHINLKKQKLFFFLFFFGGGGGAYLCKLLGGGTAPRAPLFLQP